MALFVCVHFVEIGPEIVSDVEVAFVADEQLGDVRLLGMSVLGRYLVTIDDELDRITLERRR